MKTSDPKAFFEEHGYWGPVRALDKHEIDALGVIGAIESLRRPEGSWARNRHLDQPLLAKLCRNETLVDVLQKVLGPDVIIWRSNIFALSSRSVGLPWHQDDYRTLLTRPPDAVSCSVQLNFTASTRDNCVSVIPGSHLHDDAEFRRRGYVMMPGTSEGAYGTARWGPPSGVRIVDMPLQAGEFYVFHSRLLHASLAARALSANMVSSKWSGFWGQLRGFVSARLTRENVIRYSIALRAATPNVKVAPEAFAETPSRAQVVLLSGSNANGVNRLGEWAA